MRLRLYGLLAGIGFSCLGPPAAQAEETAKFGYAGGFNFESADGRTQVKLTNRVQVLYAYNDPTAADAEGTFRIRRYKFNLEGHAFGDWKFKLQTNLASGSVLGENEQLLEDAQLQYARHAWVQPWIGQGKAFFGRQLLTSSGKLQFVDRSIATGRFAAQRQIGVGLVGHDEHRRFEYNVGIYNGEGVNKTRNRGGDYLTVARLVYTPFGEVKLEEGAHDYPASSKLAIGVAGYSNELEPTTETELVVVFDPSTGDPTGEIDEVTVAGRPKWSVRRLGLELAYKIRGFSLLGEYFDETREPAGASDVETDGYHLQAGYLFPNRRAEVALRRSAIDPDAVDADLTESGIAGSWYFARHDYKVQADFHRLDSDDNPALDTDVLRVQMQFAF